MPNVLSAITVDCIDPARLAAFWGALLGREEAPSLPGWRQLGHRGDAVPGINFQPVPEPKTGKARLHLDVRVDDIEEGIHTVLRLGGQSLDQRHDYDEGVVVVMADPEGNEFCLVQYFETGGRSTRGEASCHNERVSIEQWWPELHPSTRDWLIANNGDAVPAPIVEEIARAGGAITSDAWWVGQNDASGFYLSDAAIDWVDEVANAETPEAP